MYRHKKNIIQRYHLLKFVVCISYRVMEHKATRDAFSSWDAVVQSRLLNQIQCLRKCVEGNITKQRLFKGLHCSNQVCKCFEWFQG